MSKNLLQIVKNTAIDGETRPLVFNSKWCVDGTDHSWHWLISERSSRPSLAEWMKNAWYSGSDGVEITPQAMYIRGWRWHSQVKIPKKLRIRN